MSFYGEDATIVGHWEFFEWTEFMSYLYLPVRIPHHDQGGSDGKIVLPPNLEFARYAINCALADAMTQKFTDPYVYVTAKRGYATPGNPLNRPGWHCDDFGGQDLNYVWTNEFPTLILRSTEGLEIDSDDKISQRDMEMWAEVAEELPSGDAWVEEMPLSKLLRLTPYVIHDTPTIPEPGGMRSFLKVSVSDHRYNLIGNSHNHGIDYTWAMYNRDQLRNQPGVFQNRDYVL